jgi:hypothetical protein
MIRLTNGARALHDRWDSSGNAGGDSRNTGSNGRNTWCSDGNAGDGSLNLTIADLGDGLNLGNGSDDGSEEGE